ncbi:hypothetical protein DICVIV_10907 [Dictyocaulus viviparus]|uniref:Uncharacterized protein n=1 Tax=Dictyocaulus viviparus TaxID=29172 RepID=A0A0D8XL54_DICVI|nr:hypothetical protein DICVIV_10907 [Dictyocaulus viviparus]
MERLSTKLMNSLNDSELLAAIPGNPRCRDVTRLLIDSKNLTIIRSIAKQLCSEKRPIKRRSSSINWHLTVGDDVIPMPGAVYPLTADQIMGVNYRS